MQTIRLVGVLEDGTTRAPQMPLNTATTVLIPQFADVRIEVEVFNAAGVPVDVSAIGAAAAFLPIQRELPPCSKQPELTVVGVWGGAPGPRNLLVFSISATDTTPANGFSLGRYFFDIWVKFTSGPFAGRWQIVRPSTLVLQVGLSRP